jgi:Tfp pilus assembly protein PilW
MNIKTCKRGTARATRAMTIVELMIAVAVGSMILAVVAMVFSNSMRSFALMGNYVAMDRDSQNALDRITREIRRAGSLKTVTADKLVFTKYASTNVFVVFQWDSAAQQLTEWRTGSTATNVLLTECESLAFAMQKMSGAPATSIADAKKISVSWNCSRSLLGKKFTTEQMQQAVITVRNRLL